jgi:hypothetical protein
MIHYRITGFVTPKEQPALRIELSGENRRAVLPGPVGSRWRQREIVLVAGTDEFERLQTSRSVDVIPAVSRMDLREWGGGDLLALPLAPRHPPANVIRRRAAQAQADASAFAALARLKH